MFWAIVVFIIGIVGLLHECFLLSRGIPLFEEATSVVLMLVALGGLLSLHKKHAKK